MSQRDHDTAELISEDFDPEFGCLPESKESLLKGLVGCDHIISILEGYEAQFKHMKHVGKDPLRAGTFNLNFLLTGPPGTGIPFNTRTSPIATTTNHKPQTQPPTTTITYQQQQQRKRQQQQRKQ